jgi:hypothetical protein
MARPLRIEYPGAFYHVVNRGQSRGNMFLEGKGRQSFLDLLGYFAPFRPVVSQHSHWKNKTGSYVRNGKSEFVSFSSLRRQFKTQVARPVPDGAKSKGVQNVVAQYTTLTGVFHRC